MSASTHPIAYKCAESMSLHQSLCLICCLLVLHVTADCSLAAWCNTICCEALMWHVVADGRYHAPGQ